MSVDNALFTPTSPETSATFRFLHRINAEHSLALSSYYDLYNWSTENIVHFWSAVWDFTDILGVKGRHVVDTAALPPHNPPWFKEAQVNYAENLLRCRSPEKTALVQASTFHIISFPFILPHTFARPPVTISCLVRRPWWPSSWFLTPHICIFIPVEPEPNHPNPERRCVSYAELYALVADTVSAFLARGLKPGDRIASYSSNCIVRI